MTRSRTLRAGALAIVLAGAATLGASAQVAPATPTPPEAQVPDRADPDHRVEVRGDRHGPRGKGHHHHGARDGRDGPRGHRGFGASAGPGMMQTLFAEVDADGDGRVTQDEIDAFRAAKVRAADTSGDGALSIEEFDTLYREFTRSRMVDAFQDLDANGDGMIDKAEMDARLTRIKARMDRDGDGVLTLRGPGRPG